MDTSTFEPNKSVQSRCHNRYSGSRGANGLSQHLEKESSYLANSLAKYFGNLSSLTASGSVVDCWPRATAFARLTCQAKSLVAVTRDWARLGVLFRLNFVFKTSAIQSTLKLLQVVFSSFTHHSLFRCTQLTRRTYKYQFDSSALQLCCTGMPSRMLHSESFCLERLSSVILILTYLVCIHTACDFKSQAYSCKFCWWTVELTSNCTIHPGIPTQGLHCTSPGMSRFGQSQAFGLSLFFKRSWTCFGFEKEHVLIRIQDFTTRLSIEELGQRTQAFLR